MHIVTGPSFYSLLKQLSIWTKWAVFASVGLSCYLLLTLPQIIPFKRPKPVERSCDETRKEKYAELADSHLFGSPNFPLSFLSFRENIVVYSQRDRPDLPQSEQGVTLGLFGASPFFFPVGKRMYVATQDGKTCFTTVETPIWLEVLRLEEGSAVVQRGVSIEEGALDVEDFKLDLSTSTDLNHLLHPAYKAMENAQFLGKDLLFEMYGGEEFFVWKGKDRLKFPFEKSFGFIPISQGDLLVWNEEGWQLRCLDSGISGPAAQIHSLSNQGITIRLWNERGERIKDVKLALQRSQFFPPKLEEFIKQAKFRTQKSMSCLLNGRREIVHLGDWIVKSGDRWKILRSLSELEHLLQYEKSTSLIIVQAFEKKEGSRWLKAVAFDEMREHSAEVTLKLQTKSKKEGTSRNMTNRSTKEQKDNTREKRKRIAIRESEK